jgi:hypothetical protein
MNIIGHAVMFHLDSTSDGTAIGHEVLSQAPWEIQAF